MFIENNIIITKLHATLWWYYIRYTFIYYPVFFS